MSLDYPDDNEFVDNFGVAPSISWELGYWQRSIELPSGTEMLHFSYDQTGFVCIEWRTDERLLLSISRDHADVVSAWSTDGQAFLAVDFRGELGTDGRLTVRALPSISITDSQRL